MFSSNSRRASTVSDAVDTAGDDIALAGTCAQPIAAMITTIRVDENLVDAIRLCEKAPEILIGDFVLRDSCGLLTDNLFQNRNATRQVVSVHYKRRQKPQRVLSRSQSQQTLIPAALDNIIG